MSGPSRENDLQQATQRAETLVLQFDLRLYRLTAIKKAAYKFGDRCFVSLERSGEGKVEVTLSPKESGPAVDSLRGEFCNEVVDQDLREVVAEETEAIRSLLLAHAFSRASLLDPDLETADFRLATGPDAN